MARGAFATVACRRWTLLPPCRAAARRRRHAATLALCLRQRAGAGARFRGLSPHQRRSCVADARRRRRLRLRHHPALSPVAALRVRYRRLAEVGAAVVQRVRGKRPHRPRRDGRRHRGGDGAFGLDADHGQGLGGRGELHRRVRDPPHDRVRLAGCHAAPRGF